MNVVGGPGGRERFRKLDDPTLACPVSLPGWIDTDMTRRARERVPDLYENVLRRTPAGRWGTPRDLDGIAVFLASTGSDFITGTTIAVDGGFAIQG